MTPMNGITFEDHVERIYQMLPGVHGLKRDQRKAIKDRLGRKVASAEIDFEYHDKDWKRRYVEAKYRYNSPVTLEEVTKFKGVLDLLGVPGTSGEMVTNSTYLPRAVVWAKMHGIRLFDGDDLRRMEQYQRKRETLLEKLMPESVERALYYGRTMLNYLKNA